MSSQEQGRQSPDPENQTGAQQRDPPSDGKGVNDSENPESNKETSKKELEVWTHPNSILMSPHSTLVLSNQRLGMSIAVIVDVL